MRDEAIPLFHIATLFYKGETHVGLAGLGAERRERGQVQIMINGTNFSNGLLKTARRINVYAVQIELFIFCASRNGIAQKKVIAEMGDGSTV